MDALSRVSLGIRLPEELQAQITSLQNEIRRKGGDSSWRSSGPSELALFACTPGEMGAGNIARLGVVVKEIAATMQPFEVRITGVTGEPNAVQPRAAVLVVEGGEPFQRLAQKIEHAAVHAGVAFGGYTGHIELGRLKQLTENGRVNLGRAIKMSAKPDFPPFKISFIDIFIAVAGPTGPDLRTLERVPFATTSVVPPPPVMS